MATISSASTLNLNAYLTDRGRKFIFGFDNQGNDIRFDENGNDNFQIVSFSLFDSDINYNSFNKLQSGDIPDITGAKKECLKTVVNQKEPKNKMLFY